MRVESDGEVEETGDDLRGGEECECVCDVSLALLQQTHIVPMCGYRDSLLGRDIGPFMGPSKSDRRSRYESHIQTQVFER